MLGRPLTGVGAALLKANNCRAIFDGCREGVKRNFELAQGKAAELGTLPEMMSSAAFADFGPDRRAMVRTAASGLGLLTRLCPCCC